MTEQSSHRPDRGQIVAFPGRSSPRLHAQPSSPVEDIGKYEGQGGGTDDFRHRMLVNAAALAVCLVLVLVGVWLAREMAAQRAAQDCVLAGRRNCAQINFDGTARQIPSLRNDR